MERITAVFWDIGGVLLSNAWDREQRDGALEKLGVDPEDFERRHRRAAPEAEAGRLTLDQYLDRTVFYRRRPFGRERFKRIMFSQSRPIPPNLALARRLARSRRYLVAALNNESQDLNRWRIDRFGLRGIFDAFFSSCYLGVRKPERAIYEKALALTQRRPRECLFIDDRPENLVEPRRMGWRVILHRGPQALERDLTAALGHKIGAAA